MATDVRVDQDNLGYVTVTWASLANAESGDEARVAGRHETKTVQVSGTFDTATVAIQGSMDGSNWFTLNEDGGTGGTALEITAGTISKIRENPMFVRPSVSGGSASTDVQVIIGGSVVF